MGETMVQIARRNGAAPRRRFWERLSMQETMWGWICILPAVLGLVLFNLGPVVASLVLSFTEYDIISPPRWIGLDNYRRLPQDGLWLKSIGVTLKYSGLSIPLYLITAYLVALLMNQQARGISIYRTMWYLPSLVPGVASAALWRWLLNREFGPINYPIKVMGLPPPGWLTDPDWVVPSLVLIQLWGLGGTALIFLAALQGIPQSLYEAAEVDGANAWAKFSNITVPLSSSVIFFQLVMGVINSFQVFTTAYILFSTISATSSAGPQNSALFYVLYLYRNAFGYFRNGYACAMAWILFLAVILLTVILFWTQQHWVYYESEGRGG